MTSRNDITGDPIASRQPTDSYRSNWDRIFAVCKQCGNRTHGEAVHTCTPPAVKTYAGGQANYVTPADDE